MLRFLAILAILAVSLASFGAVRQYDATAIKYWKCYRGNWTLNQARDLNELPEDLMVGGQKISGEMKLAPFDGMITLKSDEEFDRAVVATEVELPETGEMTLAIRFDHWFDLIVNNVVIGSSTEKGQPGGKSFFIAKFPVKTGKNLITIITEAGGGLPFKHGWCGRIDNLPSDGVAYPLPPPIELTNFTKPALEDILSCAPVVTAFDIGEVMVRFHLTAKHHAGIEYRLAGSNDPWKKSLSLREGVATADMVHSARCVNLKSGATYEYRVITFSFAEGWERKGKDIFTFVAPDSGKETYTVTIFADTQVSTAWRAKMFEKFLKIPGVAESDFFAHLGDFKDHTVNFVSCYFDSGVSSFQSQVGRGIKFVMVRGNHELRGAKTGGFAELFSGMNGKNYYIFREGEVAYLVLDTVDYGRHTGRLVNEQFTETYADEQIDFAKKAVKSAAWQSAKYRVILMHRAPCGMKSGEFPDTITKFVNDLYAAIKDSGRIHLLVAGHEHCFSRTVPGEKSVRTFHKKAVVDGANYPFPCLVLDGPGELGYRLSVSQLLVSPRCLTVKSFNPEGRLFDEFSVTPDGVFSEQPIFTNMKK